jgi:hypothetical protein
MPKLSELSGVIPDPTDELVITCDLAGTPVTRKSTISDLLSLINGLLPAGGTTGQVLEKVDGTDYNIQWTAPSGVGSYW